MCEAGAMDAIKQRNEMATGKKIIMVGRIDRKNGVIYIKQVKGA